MKNKILKYIVTIIIFLITIFAINEVQAKSYTIENMDIQATIVEEGSVKVEQELTFKFNGSYNGIYIDIPDSVDNDDYDKFREQTTALRDSLYNAVVYKLQMFQNYQLQKKQITIKYLVH